MRTINANFGYGLKLKSPLHFTECNKTGMDGLLRSPTLENL